MIEAFLADLASSFQIQRMDRATPILAMDAGYKRDASLFPINKIRRQSLAAFVSAAEAAPGLTLR
jgi:hypothetical protein